MSAPMGLLPAGYMWVNAKIYEAGGWKLAATESRFLLLGDSVANPNHLWRGSVGVKKAARRWAAGTGAAGTAPSDDAAGTGAAGTVAPQVVAPQPEERHEEPSSSSNSIWQGAFGTWSGGWSGGLGHLELWRMG